jgi:hypothetical protein
MSNHFVFRGDVTATPVCTQDRKPSFQRTEHAEWYHVTIDLEPPTRPRVRSGVHKSQPNPATTEGAGPRPKAPRGTCPEIGSGDSNPTPHHTNQDEENWPVVIRPLRDPSPSTSLPRPTRIFLQVGRRRGLSALLEGDEVKSTTSTDAVPLVSERHQPEVIGEGNTRQAFSGTLPWIELNCHKYSGLSYMVYLCSNQRPRTPAPPWTELIVTFLFHFYFCLAMNIDTVLSKTWFLSNFIFPSVLDMLCIIRSYHVLAVKNHDIHIHSVSRIIWTNIIKATLQSYNLIAAVIS